MWCSITYCYPDSTMLSFYQVKACVKAITGITPIMCDMYVSLCVSYTGPLMHLQACPQCNMPWFHGCNNVPSKQFTTIPITTQIQALFRSPKSALTMQYWHHYTEQLLAKLEKNNMNRTSLYRNIFDGLDYLHAVCTNTIQNNDIVLMLSIDGTQLYQYKSMDCWIYIWLVMDLAPVEI